MIETVFFGGGTPSLFPAKELTRLLQRLRDSGRLAQDAEITLEANPGTVERHSFADLAAAGINRISLGAQSFDPLMLSRLGRIHGPDETRRAASELHAAGIENFNIDIMFALPEQTRAGAVDDLTQALSLSPAHVSHYQLTIEPNTAFARHPPVVPGDGLAWAMQEDCHAFLAEAGFEHYEVSAFARPGKRCLHNLNYWEFGDYLGIGAGAHQKLTHDSGAITRVRRRSHPTRYMREAGAESGIAGTAELSNEDRIFEFMLNALRLKHGFNGALFTQRTGLALASLQPTLALAHARGLLVSEGASWRPSDTGWRFLNDLQAMFLPEGKAA